MRAMKDIKVHREDEKKYRLRKKKKKFKQNEM